MSDRKPSDSDIRVQVRERYGRIANNESSSCCSSGSDTIAISDIYEIQDAANLPKEVTSMSLGCGDPITLASLGPGQTVLDLGSGGGIDCFLAAERVGATGHVIGVDMTPEMLDKARSNKEKMGVDNVEFRLGEIEYLPVANDHVDVIISNCVINLSPDKSQVFREAYRVLKPGGRLAISDIVTDGPLPEEIKNDLSAWAECIAGALDIREYTDAIQAAGFEQIQIRPVYLDQDFIDDAIKKLDLEKDSQKDKDYDKAIFSAKITAVKPA